MSRGFSVRASIAIVLLSIAWVTGMTATPALAYILQLREGQFPTAGYDVEDTELRESGPDASFEVNPRWNMGNFGPREREAVAFPVSLPTVTGWATSVKLEVWQSDSNSGHTRLVELHSITNANYVNESTATWNSANTGSPWATPGGDFSSTILSSVTVNTTTLGTHYEFSSTPALVNAVNNALFGDGIFRFMAKVSTAEEGSFGYVSFIAADNNGHALSLRPLLTIEYVPEPASAAVLALGAMALCLRRRSRAVAHCLIMVGFVSVLAMHATPASAAIATFQEGGLYDVEDADIRSTQAATDPGNGTGNSRWNAGELFGTTYRSVIAFPISLPLGSIVTSAKIEVRESASGTFGTQTQVSLYRLTNTNYNDEAAVNWIRTDFANSGSAWTTPGGDFDPTALASLTPTAVNNTLQTFSTSPAFVSAVNNALAGDGVLRLLLKSTAETPSSLMSFWSSDSGSDSLSGLGTSARPLLTLEYIPEPSALGLLAIGGIAMLRRRK
jgi:hypothetical protein